MTTKNGYTIYSTLDAFAVHAHAQGGLTLEHNGQFIHIAPENVEVLREVLRLSAGLHAQARRRASRAAYTERYGEE